MSKKLEKDGTENFCPFADSGYTNKEGFITPPNLDKTVCLDWDSDCKKCLIEKMAWKLKEVGR